MRKPVTINRQSGRLLELPILAAVLGILGVWIGSAYHPSGYIIAVIPIVVWAGMVIMERGIQASEANRVRQTMGVHLSTVSTQNFDPQLVLKGNLKWSKAWAAFDFTRGEVAVMFEDDVIRQPISQLRNKGPSDNAPLNRILSDGLRAS